MTHTIQVLTKTIKFLDKRINFSNTDEDRACFKAIKFFVQAQIKTEAENIEMLKRDWNSAEGLAIHVICLDENDIEIIKAAYIADRFSIETIKLMDDMAKKYYEENKTRFRSYNEYKHCCFWHIHTIKLLNPERII